MAEQADRPGEIRGGHEKRSETTQEAQSHKADENRPGKEAPGQANSLRTKKDPPVDRRIGPTIRNFMSLNP